jgi:nucleotide-binding universal stress UspA family protein
VFKRILVAVDGSRHATKAAEAAIALARQTDAKLFIISVAARSDPEEELWQLVENEHLTRSLDIAIEESVQVLLADVEQAARAAGLN